MQTTHYIYTFALASLLALPSAAQRRMSMDECVSMALERNLTLRSGQIAVEKAEALQGTSFDLEPTELSLSQDPTSGGSPDNAISLSQTFSMPTVYTSRRKLLKAETGVERSRLVMSRNELVRNVRSAYCTLAHRAQRLSVFSQRDSIISQFCRIAAARFVAGESGQLEKMNAERLKRENAIATAQARRDLEAAQMKLALWMNADSASLPTADIAEVRLAEPSSLAFDAAATPLSDLLAKQLEVSVRSLKSVRQQSLPTLSVGASTQLVVKGFNPYHVDRSAFDKGDFMGFSVGVNVPLSFGAQKARLRAAKKDIEAASLQRDQQMRELETDYKVSLGEYEKARAALEYYEREGLGYADEMAHISQVSYESGSISYVELMQNLEASSDIRMNYLEALDDYNQSVVELKYLKGE